MKCVLVGKSGQASLKSSLSAHTEKSQCMHRLSCVWLGFCTSSTCPDGLCLPRWALANCLSPDALLLTKLVLARAISSGLTWCLSEMQDLAAPDLQNQHLSLSLVPTWLVGTSRSRSTVNALLVASRNKAGVPSRKEQVWEEAPGRIVCYASTLKPQVQCCPLSLPPPQGLAVY